MTEIVNWIESRYKLFVAALTALYFFPAVTSDTLYRDDNARAVVDIYLWITGGRPIADIVNAIFTLSGTTLNFSGSFLQLLALFCVVISIIRTLSHLRGISNLPLTLPVTSLFLSIFFIQNISYSFDSFSMSLAMLIASVAYCSGSGTGFRHSTKAVLLLFVAAGLYQPMLNVFLGLAALEITLSALSGRSFLHAMKSLGLRALQYLGGCLLYLSVVLALGIRPENGQSQHISVSSLPEEIWLRIGRIVHFVFEGMAVHAGVFHFMTMGATVLATVAICYMVLKGKLRIGGGVLILVAYGIAAFSIFGFLIGFEAVSLDYRIFPTSGVFLSISIIVISAAYRDAALIASLPLYASVLVSFQSFAMLASQQELDRIVMWQAASELAKLDLADRRVRVFGATPIAQTNGFEVEKNRFFAELVRPASNSQAEAILLQHGILQVAPIMFSGARLDFVADRKSQFCAESLLLSENGYFQIREFEDSYFVILSGKSLLDCHSPN